VLIGTRTRDLPVCSIVPQPTTLPRAPYVLPYLSKMKMEATRSSETSVIRFIQHHIPEHRSLYWYICLRSSTELYQLPNTSIVCLALGSRYCLHVEAKHGPTTESLWHLNCRRLHHRGECISQTVSRRMIVRVTGLAIAQKVRSHLSVTQSDCTSLSQVITASLSGLSRTVRRLHLTHTLKLSLCLINYYAMIEEPG
jgi:hypothetical protein